MEEHVGSLGVVFYGFVIFLSSNEGEALLDEFFGSLRTRPIGHCGTLCGMSGLLPSVRRLAPHPGAARLALQTRNTSEVKNRSPEEFFRRF